jgi:hypothetical protein
MSTVGHDHSEQWTRWLISRAALGKSLNGIPAPLEEDEDSDFGHESWYDCKDDKKRITRGRRRSGKRGEHRRTGAGNLVDGDNERVANFNLLDHSFPSDESDKEFYFDHSHSKPLSHPCVPVA